MTTELTLALIEKLACTAGCLAWVIAIGGIFVGFFCSLEHGGRDTMEDYLLPWLCLLVFFAALSSIPTVNDLWKVRVGLIKLQLSSPENVSKGVDEIQRIGKRLEEKYLGKEEEK